MREKSVKRRYIEAAYDLLMEGGAEAISARKVAAKAGCAPSAFYRHFDSLDELIMYASFRYLKNSYIEMESIAYQKTNALDRYMSTEVFFAHFTLAAPRIFDNLAFGQHSSDYLSILKDFLDMYGDSMPDYDIYVSPVLKQNNFSASNRVLLSNCVEEGMLDIAPGKLELVNNLIVKLYKGFLKTALEHENEGTLADHAEAIAEDYLSCYREVLSFYRTVG